MCFPFSWEGRASEIVFVLFLFILGLREWMKNHLTLKSSFPSLFHFPTQLIHSSFLGQET